MANYGTDRVVLQDTTGTIQNDDGFPIISTDSNGESSYPLGSSILREVFFGITNGDFSQPTAAIGTADFATVDNPLPYWGSSAVATPSTGTIGFQSVEDSTTPSGFKLRVLATAGATTGGTTILSRMVALGANASRDVGFSSTLTVGIDATATNATNRTLSLAGVFYAADGTTIAGTAFAISPTSQFADYLSELGAGVKTYELGDFLPPSNAAFLRYEFTAATTGTNATERWIDIIDVSLYRTPPLLRVQEVNTPSIYTQIRAGQIISAGTPLVMRGGTSTANTINLNNGTLTADYYITSGGVRIGGDTVGGTVLFGTSGSSFDTNLYRPAANTLKTDDTFVVGAGTILFGTAAVPDTNLYRHAADNLRTDDAFVVGSRTSASVNQVDAPGAMLDAAAGFAWVDRSPNSAATDASLFLSSGYFNGNLQMVRFFRKITVGGTALTGTGHILVANNATTAPSFGAGSDWRLKSDVRDASDEINFVEKINDLRPVLYTETGSGDENLLGFIAHEVQAVIPNAVEGAKDAVDANGDPVYQMLYPAKFIPYLVGAVRELTARVEQLEAKVAHLESAE
jgi:hypothetical protein